MAIAASFFFTFLAAAMVDYFFGPLSYFDPAPWQELFLGAGVMLVLGAWDDMRPLKASTKFLVQLGAAGLAIGLGFQIHDLPLLGYPISSQILSISLALLWILLVIVLASVVGLRKLGYRELEVMRRGLAPGSEPAPDLIRGPPGRDHLPLRHGLGRELHRGRRAGRPV